MEPPNVNADNFIYWKHTSDGLYTVSSAYKTLIAKHAKIDANAHVKFWRQFWKLKLHPCCQLFVWKLMHNTLPTKELLLQKGLQLSHRCVFYKQYPETADHLFRLCEVAQVIWKSGDLGLRASMNPHIPLQQWISDFIAYFLKNDRHDYGYRTIVFCSTLWAIWLARNDIKFRQKNVNPIQILHRSKELARQQFLLLSNE
ncbi:uncharacterized protein LOC141607909 [Silene latifolia]|uniref:uncharacterized protein LOC141607909 n=1 Tax=Silene latifolia TaxID=37657 RepID=UPI003D77D02E